MTIEQKLNQVIRDIPDFPKPGILFKDITPIFKDYKLCAEIVENIANHFADKQIDVVAGIESRGFLFGTAIAGKLGVPFVPVRKVGKLPYHTVSYKYDLEYGSSEIEMHRDAIEKGQRVLIHDDLLATGGTALAASELMLKLGGKVGGYSFLIDLEFLEGASKLKKFTPEIHSLVKY
jgi:adenine phosphoribosyltransferase